MDNNVRLEPATPDYEPAHADGDGRECERTVRGAPS